MATNSSSTQVILPHDLIFEILGRLPIESIIRFKSVCKKWNRMTQDPVFINSQLSWSKVHPPKLLLTTNAEPTSIFLTETSEFKAKKLIDVNDVEKPIVMCSFNGLICLGSRTHLDPLKICNPTTMELLELPHSNFTDSVRHHRAALGYDNITKRYKVVRSYQSGVGSSFLQIIEVLNPGETIWKKIRDRGTDLVEWDGPVFHDGAFYCYYDDRVLQLDLSTGKFLNSPQLFPTPLPFSWPCLSLLNFEGHLVLTVDDTDVFCKHVVNNGSRHYFDKMDLKCNDTEWDIFVLSHVNLISMPSEESYIFRYTTMNDHGRMTTFLVSYHAQNKIMTPLFCSEDFNAISFKPSLLSPNMVMSFGHRWIQNF